MTKLAIKVDIDTLRGYREGMPRMLELFKKHSIKASIFFSFGPDNSGKAIRRIFRKGFISKMLRTKAPSTYGIKTLLYGTLLPAPLIVSTKTDIFLKAIDEGHDCGVHAWDHVLVQDKLDGLSKEDFKNLYKRAADSFTKLSGKEPTCYAAPGWQISHSSLKAMDELGVIYCSDVRGSHPFIPVFEDIEYQTPQIPTTLPTMDEIYGLPGINDDTIPSYWLERMNEEYNVLTVHAEMEGLSKLGVFEEFLILAKEKGTKFYTLKEYLGMAELSPSEIILGNIAGRAGTVAIQEGD